MLVQTFPVLLDVDDELKNDHPRENREMNIIKGSDPKAFITRYLTFHIINVFPVLIEAVQRSWSLV